LHPGLGYRGGGILAELHTVIQASSGLAYLLEIDRRDCAQFHFPCWASPILKDEPARAGFAEPKSKTRDVVIPIDMLRFAGRRRQRVNFLRCDLHDPPVARPLGRTWEDPGWPSVPSGGRDDCLSRRDFGDVQAALSAVSRRWPAYPLLPSCMSRVRFPSPAP